jgi:pyruvate-formate lyase-activating enzyme
MLESSTPPAMADTLSPAEVAALSPSATPASDPLAAMRERLVRTGQWQSHQMAGRRWPMACVSLEITQRCNLDCTLCYLSDSAEAVRDLPLDEVFRRIGLIHAHYGPGIDVQVSGGEPTLRRADELLAIVERLAAHGMRPSLLTNGIKASRDLLQRLAAAGLVDVAFHVDTTQQRQGHRTEEDLNAVRREYIERARGLPVGVFFNTTVHAGNLGEVAMLADFFKAHADVVRFASFQLQAETGRGVWGSRGPEVTAERIGHELQRGIGTRLNFNTLLAGHHDCNRSAVALVVNGRAYDAFEDEAFVRRFMRETAALAIDRRTPWRGLRSLLVAAASRPALALASLRWTARLALKMRRDLWASRGRVHKLTFFTHDFMDACALDRERIGACVFMAMTQHGPLSMCAYNAHRDDYLLQPLPSAHGEWQPLRAPPGAAVPVKFLKGRARQAWLAEHRAGTRAPAP